MTDDGLAVASIQVGPLDDMVLGIHPVHAAAGVINGEAVGPEQMCVCNDPPVGAVHVGVFDARCVAPVCPVDLTEEESGTVVVSLLVSCCLLVGKRNCCQYSIHSRCLIQQKVSFVLDIHVLLIISHLF